MTPAQAGVQEAQTVDVDPVAGSGHDMVESFDMALTVTSWESAA